MKYELALIGLAAAVSAREMHDTTKYWKAKAKREVPQEQSHLQILRDADTALKLNNPLEIVDSVFGLLGNAAAATGAPNVQNLDCLQQIIADQAFTNAKAAGDLKLQAAAILYRSLEKNTLQVGLASPACNEQAVNPEIAAIQQHQDPASPEASGNADIELAVAIQLASIGEDPIRALESATFAPGQLGDPTAAGNTCNDDADPGQGCIFTLNLLTPAVDEAQIQAAVAGAGGVANNAGAGAAAGNAGAAADAGKFFVHFLFLCGITNLTGIKQTACAASGNAGAAAGNAGAAAAGNAGNAQAGAGNAGNAATATVNVQAFNGDLGGPPPAVQSTTGAARPFEVNGATFLNAGAAIQRSCAVQKNACSNAANSGQIDGGTGQCDAQEAECLAANARRRRRAEVRRRQDAGAFGSCGSPAIQFAPNLDGRQQNSFQNVNNADFNHGSALNIKIIAEFTCNRLESSCKADAEVVAACEQGTAAAGNAQGQAAADAFNAALGV